MPFQSGELISDFESFMQGVCNCFALTFITNSVINNNYVTSKLHTSDLTLDKRIRNNKYTYL